MVCPYCGKEIERPTREHFFHTVCLLQWMGFLGVLFL